MENVETNNTIVKKGYEFLRELCSFNADLTSFTKNINPISNRVQYIINQLETYNIPYTIDKFQPIRGVPDFINGLPAEVNIIVEIEGQNNNITTMFTAHHDVNNPKSENCCDNGASVANLIDLAIKLHNDKPKNNVVICFNDSEEKVSIDTSGCARISKQIKEGKYGNIEKIFVLELTANGRNYWMSFRNSSMKNKPNLIRVNTPFSDSVTFEMNNLPSICIGSLNDENVTQYNNRRFPYTWMQCHQMTDTFDNHANEGDMDSFIEFLITLI